jgi:serine/threonine protein kinase/tetratricopeptide (TPR) repeat protein
MNQERWAKVQFLFHETVDRPENERQQFLEAECGGDATLVAEVLALIAADASSESLLDRGVAEAAHRVIGPHSADDPSLPTTEFGPYRITGVLGEGGMGVVYLAERPDLGSRAAIKILRDAWLSPARRERFAAEQRTLAQLNHPSIARIYDAGMSSEGTPWFVMEYVEGVPITTYCREHSSTIPERLSLFRKVCEAVQHAHSQLVIHRDLKPSNILARPDGTVKLLDFGISKQLDSLDDLADQTRTGIRLMTPAYAAPEQMRGDRVGLHTDVYSLGVVLYELLVGRLPFDLANRSRAEAERILLEREPERPSVAARRMEYVAGGAEHVREIGGGAWADLDLLCLTAMHKDPQRRYRTVEALTRDLDHFLEHQPLEAHGDSARYRMAKFATRNRSPLIAGATALAVVILLVVFYTLQLKDTRNVAVAEAARAQRIQQLTLNLFQGGSEEAGPADSLRVVTLVDRGVQEARNLNHEPAIQAQLYETLGSIYQKLGNLPRADTLLRASLDQRHRLFGQEHADVAQSLIALGMLRNAQAEYDSAEALVRRGMEMTRRQLPPTHPAVSRAATSLGQVLEERGDYDRAIAVLDSAARLQSQLPTVTPELAATVTQLANTHFYAGNYAISDTLNRRALAMDRKLYGDRHPHVADDLLNLGAIQFEWQHYPEAERYDRQALEIIRSWYGNNHPETASNLTLLGRALVSQKKLDEATVILREAVGIQQRVYGPVHPRVASALNELGRTAQLQGRLDEAEANFRRMTQIYRTVYNDKHYYIGVALSNLAGVYHERKQDVEAERIFRDVIRRYREVLTPDHQLMGIAQVRLGETLVPQRRYADAERELLAGYAILKKQTSPPPTWVLRARTGLVAAYDSLHKPDAAAKFRAELAAAAKPSP